MVVFLDLAILGQVSQEKIQRWKFLCKCFIQEGLPGETKERVGEQSREGEEPKSVVVCSEG